MCEFSLHKILHMASLQYLVDKSLCMRAHCLIAPQLFFPAGWQHGRCSVVDGLHRAIDSHWPQGEETHMNFTQEQQEETGKGSGYQKWGPSLCSKVSFQLCRLPFWFTRSTLAYDSRGACPQHENPLLLICWFHLSQINVADVTVAKCCLRWISRSFSTKSLCWGPRYGSRSAGHRDLLDVKTI